MTTGAEYKVPAQIQFKGDFYNKNYLGITIPITEAPWEGSAPAHRGEEIYLKPVVDNDGLMTISGATAQGTRRQLYHHPRRIDQ